MAFTGITATEAQIDQKSGANVSDSFTDTMKTQALLMAESRLNVLTKFNWSDWFALSPDVDLKSVVTNITASMVAMDAINFDMSGFISRTEAQTKLDVLDDVVKEGIGLLKEQDKKNWVEANDGVA